jgi:hypothetical protein
MARAALLAHQARSQGSDDPFYPEKIASAHFYAHHLLPRTQALRTTVESDSTVWLELGDEAF